ncbi:DEAD/DEAH box helicase [Agromyces sp. GXS1127]|uniref:DEAD/DEAH box helicase n=1 Tax=Agromyces sp. GXS1127 TaxID=3424181 RepID=UPI003D319D62
MEYELRGYQTKAAKEIVDGVQMGADLFVKGKTSAISLSAPTGAGKTIIAAAAIEDLIFGESVLPGDEPIVLWVSLYPNLNEQTRDKFERASEKLRGGRLHVIDASPRFIVEHLTPGHVYFLNTHKLRDSSTNFTKGDQRQIALWETLNNSVERYGSRFLMFVDEAHQGTGTGASSNGDSTILGQLAGGTGKMQRTVPIVVGISATPERFEKNIAASRSFREPVEVDVNDVRESGLVKDQLVLAHPTEEIASDSTLVREAAIQRAQQEKRWLAWADENTGESLVEPVLLVQLPAKPNEASVAGFIKDILEADSTLTIDNFANALEGSSAVTFGGYDVRYVDPPRIQETTGVKVVLFKDALTTGWDCPRAEVLVSLRGTNDDVTITQLVGRIVRTPLAKRVAGDDNLNAVWTYLPHFNQDAVARVADRLRTGDTEVATPVVVNPIPLVRNPAVPAEVWAAFEDFPTWSRPAQTARPATSRVLTAAMVLSKTELLKEAPNIAQDRAVDTLVQHIKANQQFVDEKVAAYEEVDYVTTAIDWLTGEQVASEAAAAKIATRNVADLFSLAVRRLPDNSAKWLWDRLFMAQPDGERDGDAARLVVAAVAQQPDSARVVEDSSQTLLETWRKQYAAPLSEIGGTAEADFWAAFAESKKSEEVPLQAPADTVGKDASDRWKMHLLAADDGLYPFEPSNKWERAVLNTELARPNTVGWYRNPSSGKQSIAIAYGPVGDQHLVHPDFIVFTQRDDKVLIDIVDPHDPSRADTIAKWGALAQYAQQNAGRLGRVLAVIDEKKGTDELVQLNLAGNKASDAMIALAAVGGTEADLRVLFEQYGGRYQ